MRFTRRFPNTSTGVRHDSPVQVLTPLTLVAVSLLGADHRWTAAEVVEQVSTALSSDHDARRLAQELHRVRLAEQLSPQVVRYFGSLGLGVEALAALETLRDQSSLLPLPTKPPLSIQPIPAPEQQQIMLERLLQYARSYIRSLPDFLCDQVTQRYTNLKGVRANGKLVFDDQLSHHDHFTRSLRFMGGAEQSQMVQASQKTGDVMTKAGQSISSGEFGGDLLIVFGPQVRPALSWDHWERFRGEQRAVLRYFVNASQSQFTLQYCCEPSMNIGEQVQLQYHPAIQGFVYMDPSTGRIVRLTIQAAQLPTWFPTQESNTVIDYDCVSIGDRAYILPIRAILFLRAQNGQKNRNEISFTQYRKFEAQSVLTFGPASAPDKAGAKK